MAIISSYQLKYSGQKKIRKKKVLLGQEVKNLKQKDRMLQIKTNMDIKLFG